MRSTNSAAQNFLIARASDAWLWNAVTARYGHLLTEELGLHFQLKEGFACCAAHAFQRMSGGMSCV